MSTESLEKETEVQEKNVKNSAGNPAFDMTKVFTALESSQQSGSSSGLAGTSKNIEEELANKAKRLIQEIQGNSSSARASKVVIDKSVIVKDHVDLLMREFEIDKSKAEQTLSSHGGDLTKAMLALVV